MLGRKGAAERGARLAFCSPNSEMAGLDFRIGMHSFGELRNKDEEAGGVAGVLRICGGRVQGVLGRAGGAGLPEAQGLA